MVPTATREVRFAVVLYGGVSLAIYMNGISQELLRMVRGSSDLPDTALDDVEKIYRELSGNMPDNRGQKTRFLIDIISGTSAGGINGVALAKALVAGSRDLTVLKQAWTDDADIGLLLNDRGLRSGKLQPSDALLDGQHMYDILQRTLNRMNPPPGTTAPLVQMMDLFVTATDLDGRRAPLQLTGDTLQERIHKTVFHFSYEGAQKPADEPEINDFSADTDALLAFAARCTSSFPVAFPPMRFRDIPPAALQGAADATRLATGDPGFADRQFADGGYLDNRPFSHAIDLIPFRPTTLPGQRKLLFIDPFPEAADDPDHPRVAPDYDFLQNARLGAMTLPRRETIRDDLRAISRLNARLDRLATLQKRWKDDRNALANLGLRFKTPGKPDNIENRDLADFINDGYGETYPLYHHLRVYGATDTLSALAGHLAGFDPRSDETAYMRQIVRAWREAHFSAYRSPDKATEMAFLSRFDIDFRLRRLVHLRAILDAQMRGRLADILPGLRRQIEEQLAGLRRLATPAAIIPAEILTADELARLTALIRARFTDVMSATSFDSRFEAARKVYEEPAIRVLVDKAMAGIGARLRRGFDESSAILKAALTGEDLKDLLQVYHGFHWHDVTTLPFLEGSDWAEHAEVQVFRISPADSSLNDNPAKLAGIAVGAFGGFLNRDWREHDILWGRLDGAEQIVKALLPDPADAALRADYVHRLQDAILKEEFGIQNGKDRRLALLRAKLANQAFGDESRDAVAAGALGVTDPPPLGLDRFREHYKATKPLGPRPAEIANWGSRSADILSRMIGDLPDRGALSLAGNRLSGGLRLGAVLTARFCSFAMPGSFRRLQAERILFQLILAGALLVAISFFSDSVPGWIGWLVIVVAVVVWKLLYLLGRWLRGQQVLPETARFALKLLIALLIGIGIWTCYTTIVGLWRGP